ncbi:MAG: response regulator [Acidobacteria bacterium]|nr:response regulator [Acidobacteriota bacterium]
MSSKRVLVVDDDPEILEAIREVVALGGYRVHVCTSGEDCLAKATSEPPDVIVLDLVLDTTDGWQVLRVLKQQPSTRDVPVIVISHQVEHRDMFRGLQEGAVDYLEKPLERESLLASIQAAVSHRAAGGES